MRPVSGVSRLPFLTASEVVAVASDRDLRTTREQVFGDVAPGTECRICGRNVEDGRAKTCSAYCDNLLTAVMGMLNWSSVRRQIIDRDEQTCQHCGFDYALERRARYHIRDRIDEVAGERPESPGLDHRDEEFDWDSHLERVDTWEEDREAAKNSYGDPYDRARDLEVDHITPIVDGGHPFDPGNLQTLCSTCHREKTAEENSERTPTRGDLSESLLEYVSERGEAGAE